MLDEQGFCSSCFFWREYEKSEILFHYITTTVFTQNRGVCGKENGAVLMKFIGKMHNQVYVIITLAVKDHCFCFFYNRGLC